MQAHETIDVAAAETRVRGACFVSGCTCKDARIVSYRRAAFFAAMARRSGQSSDRVVAAELEWRLPSTRVIDLESSAIFEGLHDQNHRAESPQTTPSTHYEIER
jgi:hypothetical protein